MRLADVSDIEIGSSRRIRVREYPGNGTPVVLLHGLLDSSEGWHEIATRSQRYCITVDLPGFGGSTCPPYERIGMYARDVAVAINRLGIERYVLVGHSFGGAVAAALAEQRPDDVAALCLIAPVGW